MAAVAKDTAFKCAFADSTLAVDMGPNVAVVPPRHQRTPTIISHRQVRRRPGAGRRVACAHQATARAQRSAHATIRP